MKFYTADIVFTILTTLGVLAFVLRYGLRAPWYKSVEGVGLFGMMLMFLLILLNLLADGLFDWVYYRATRAILMGGATVFIVYQNILLHREQKRAKGRYSRKLGRLR